MKIDRASADELLAKLEEIFEGTYQDFSDDVFYETRGETPTELLDSALVECVGILENVHDEMKDAEHEVTNNEVFRAGYEKGLAEGRRLASSTNENGNLTMGGW